MDWRRKWRVFDGRSGEPLFAADPESRLWLPGGECLIAATLRPFATLLDEADHSGAAVDPGVRVRLDGISLSRESPRTGLCAAIRQRDGAGCEQLIQRRPGG